MTLVPSLLQAIIRLDGEAVVMHVGDRPYVVTPTGQVDLATRGLTFEAVTGIVNQLLPPDSQRALDEFGAAQHELPAMPEFPGEYFTIVAARGGDDVWAEIRRRQVAAEDRLSGDVFGSTAIPSTPQVPASTIPSAPAPVSAIPVSNVSNAAGTTSAKDDALSLPDASQLWPASTTASVSDQLAATDTDVAFDETSGSLTIETAAPMRQHLPSEASPGFDDDLSLPDVDQLWPESQPPSAHLEMSAPPAAHASVESATDSEWQPLTPVLSPVHQHPAPELIETAVPEIHTSAPETAPLSEPVLHESEPSVVQAIEMVAPLGDVPPAIGGREAPEVSEIPELTAEWESPHLVSEAPAPTPVAETPSFTLEPYDPSLTPEPTEDVDSTPFGAFGAFEAAAFDQPALPLITEAAEAFARLAETPAPAVEVAHPPALVSAPQPSTVVVEASEPPVLEAPAPVAHAPAPLVVEPPAAVVHQTAPPAVTEASPEPEVFSPVVERPAARVAAAAVVAPAPVVETPAPAPVAHIEMPVSAPAAPTPVEDTPVSISRKTEPVPVPDVPTPVSETPAQAPAWQATLPTPVRDVPSSAWEASSKLGELPPAAAWQPPPPMREPLSTPDWQTPPPPRAQNGMAGPDMAAVLPLARNSIRPDVPPPLAAQALSNLDQLLRLAAARGASMLYLSSASRPSVRVDGEIYTLDGAPILGPNDVESLLLTLMPERNAEALRTGVASEWIAELPEVGRVRCLSFRDHRGPGGVFRMMPVRAITAEQLGLSREIQALGIEPEGLVLVAGPRASGKRTLISAFVDLINRTRRDHIISIESEINVVHERNGSLISQREVRGGADELYTAARGALREDPDVLVLEEVRTAALMNLALEAAASGHLVIGGFPAHNASGAVDRIIDLYPPEYRRQVQISLAQNLRGVVSQVLLRKRGGGRLAAREVLLNTPAVASVLAEGRTSQLPLAIEGGRKVGMMPLNDALVGYVQSGAVDVQEAYRRSADRAGFLALLKRQGVDTSAVERLA